MSGKARPMKIDPIKLDTVKLTNSIEFLGEYESPITFCFEKHVKELCNAIDETSIRCIINTGVEVNKEELLKALAYDRRQYEQGWKDAKKEIVHCIDCKHLMFSDMYGECSRCNLNGLVNPDDYCSRGERK